jgi:hypothetical protein
MDPVQAEIDKLNGRIEFESMKPEVEIDERLISFLKAERQVLFDRQDRLFLQMRKMQDIQIDARAVGLFLGRISSEFHFSHRDRLVFRSPG